jgi:hypothetical protein
MGVHEINVQFKSGLYKKNGRYRQRIRAQRMFKRTAFKKDVIILNNLFINRVNEYIDSISAKMTFVDRVFMMAINPIVDRYSYPYMQYYSQWFMFKDIITVALNVTFNKVDVVQGSNKDEQSSKTKEEIV